MSKYVPKLQLSNLQAGFRRYLLYEISLEGEWVLHLLQKKIQADQKSVFRLFAPLWEIIVWDSLFSTVSITQYDPRYSTVLNCTKQYKFSGLVRFSRNVQKKKSLKLVKTLPKLVKISVNICSKIHAQQCSWTKLKKKIILCGFTTISI